MATARRTTAKTKTVAAPEPAAPVDVSTRDADGRTPLHWAAFYGYTSTVRTMLQQQDADANARDNQQRTPGHWAAFKGYLPVVKLLVANGADVNARDEAGRTLLAMAQIGRQPDVETYIRDNGGEK
jgi:ankyrin repeat protein